MAGLNDDAQWIVLMGFIVSFSLFFLALVINQSTVVGQTTSESVIEFPKNDIRDITYVIKDHARNNGRIGDTIHNDITGISGSRKGAVVNYSMDLAGLDHSMISDPHNYSIIHYNNGVTRYNENWTSR